MKNKDPNAPILITGSHRCGSTWLASLLGLARATTVLQEPFNVAPHFYALGGNAKRWFAYAPDIGEAESKDAFKLVLSRSAGRVYERRNPARYLRFLRRGRLIIKDPIAAFSAEWLVTEFGVVPLVLVRHPAAFAASLKRLSWYFPFEDLASQEQLIEDVLFPFRDDLMNPPQEVVEQAALLWLVIYHALDLYASRGSDWTVVRHEDISEDPVMHLKNLYRVFGLDWEPRIETRVRGLSHRDNPTDPRDGAVHVLKRNSRENIKRWRRVLSSSEVSYIRKATISVSEKYYDAGDW